ncbi:MAG: hypothetical protein J6F30_08340 [Cellulosilyticum sp.]|nr:hypothetical protein [Cellulosilyticum sp.]
MLNLFKSLKFWEICFIALSIILITPLFIEFLFLTIAPLAAVGIISSVLAFKKRKFAIIIINTLILIGSLALYIFLW